MRIAVLAAAYPPDIRGGGEISTKLISEALANEGAEISVLAIGEEENKTFVNNVEIFRIRSPNCHWNFKAPSSAVRKTFWHALDNYNPRAIKKIEDFLEHVQPQIFITSTVENFGAAPWLISKRKTNFKTVHKLRSYYTFCMWGTAFKNGQNCTSICASCRLGSIGRRIASRNVDGVIGLSNSTLKIHLSHGLFSNAATAIIPDPVTVRSSERAVQTARRQSRVIGYLGFITPNKGIELIAEALRLLDENQRPSLMIAGTGGNVYTTALKKQFSGLDCSFVGWQQNSNFLSSIDYLVVPSRFREPFGRIVVEAFANQVPVIGSNIGGIGEMVRSGHDGFLFDAGSAQSLAKSLLMAYQLSDEAYSVMRINASISSERYVGSVVARRNLEFFDALLSGDMRPGSTFGDTAR